MTTRGALLAGAMLGLMLAAPPALGFESGEAPVGAPATPAAELSADRVIVQWRPGADAQDRRDAREDADVAFQRGLGRAAFQLVRVQEGQTADGAVAELESDPAVLVATRDGWSTPQAVPNDPLLGQLWGLRNLGGAGIDGFSGAVAGADVNAAAAWNRTVGTPSTVMAIIDSGYRFNHPDLAAVAWTNPADPPGGGDNDGNGIVDDSRGADFVGNSADSPATDGDPTDNDLITGGHGAHVAGTAGAKGNDGKGITGVAQNARIMPLRVCANAPSLNPPDARCPFSSQVLAINYAGSHGARVANMSLGGTTSNQAVVNALALNPGTLYVISAGNDSEDNDNEPHHYPCDYQPTVDAIPAGTVDNVICVAATDQADQLADFSDYGATSVDLGAPGTETYSAHPVRNRFLDTFETDNFATAWTATGVSGGFGRTDESPLTSFGMGDTPNGPALVSTTRESFSTPFALPAGLGSCQFTQTRNLSVGTGNEYRYGLFLSSSQIFLSNAVTSSGTISTVPVTAFNAGGNVQIMERYVTGATTPSQTDGAWLDDLRLDCYEPAASTVATYKFLQGTSMAAPHVTGAAALLFSLKPSATVSQVRAALLGSVDQVPALAGKTVTGGRLDVSKALNALVPPPPVVAGNNPPPPPPPPAAKCKVPKLKGKSLAKAKASLTKANCKLGKVTKPKKRKGKKLPPLVVKSTTPGAGRELAAGSKVAVKLVAKPKPKNKRR